MRAVRAGTVTATSSPLHVGRTLIVVDTELRDDAGKLVARTTQTQAVIGGAKLQVSEELTGKNNQGCQIEEALICGRERRR